MLSDKLLNTDKPVVLIVEDDPQIASGLAIFFHSKNYCVYVESSVDNARRKLQVFDYSKTLVDLAFIQNSADQKGAAFVSDLHRKYANVKTVVIQDSKNNPAIASAFVHRDDDIVMAGQIAHDTLRYSQEMLNEYIKAARIKDKKLKEIERTRQLAYLSKHTPAEIAAALDKKRQVAAKIAPIVLQLFDAWDNVHLRRQYWKEIVGKSKVYKHNIKIMTIVGMFRLYKAYRLRSAGQCK
jgi:ActR/RegA family two-component response regulator